MLGTIEAKVGSGRSLYLLSGPGSGQHLEAKSLHSLMRMASGRIHALKVTIRSEEATATSYHIYRGGRFLGLSIPREHCRKGQIVAVTIKPLLLPEFVFGLRGIRLINSRKTKWVADSATLSRFKLVDDKLTFYAEQDHPLVNLRHFRLNGKVRAYPGICSQYRGVHLEFVLEDYAGRLFRFRIRDNGFESPGLQYPAGGSFKSVWFLSFDGVRLNVVYGSQRNIATIYLRPPSEEMYRIGPLSSYSGPNLKLVRSRYSNAFVVKIYLLRKLERAMLNQGLTYDGGRLGIEIAYLIATTVLNLGQVLLREPSAGGRDLHTEDGEVAIQSRLLKDVLPVKMTMAAQVEMFKLVTKLKEDFRYNPAMKKGFAILLLKIGKRSLQSIVVELPKPL